MPSPASFPTGQTTPLPESPAENGRRPFTLIHLIERVEYCRKRDFGLQMGPEYLEMFWEFEALQRWFKRRYGWEPGIGRFEDFEESRRQNVEFWIMWDYPTNCFDSVVWDLNRRALVVKL
jgi:hypothetical protein